MIKKSLFVFLALIGIASFHSIVISAESDSAADKLISDYINNPYLASALVNTAGQCAWDRKYDDAKRLYQAVINEHPNNPYIRKARMGLSRLEILNLIAEKNWPLEQQQVNSMVADFNGEPDLSMALFHIGKELTWQHQYSDAKNTFNLLLNQPASYSISEDPKLWSARANVCSMIGKSAEPDIIEAIDKLIKDFGSDPGLPEAIYWISKEYEWKKSAADDRTGWYDAPNSVFQRLNKQFGDTSFGKEAEWDQKRLMHRMKIFKLMQETNENETSAAIETMVNDLSGRPEVVGELLWIAWGYEEQAGKRAMANQLYERIIAEYPDSIEAKDAYYLSGAFYSQSKEYTKAIEKFKVVVANWPDYQFACSCYYLIGHHYQQLSEDGQVSQDAANAETKAAYQQITKSYPNCNVNRLVKIWLIKHTED